MIVPLRCFLTDDTKKGETRDRDKQSGLAGAFVVMPLGFMDNGPHPRCREREGLTRGRERALW